jgi:hypothetical protein
MPRLQLAILIAALLTALAATRPQSAVASSPCDDGIGPACASQPYCYAIYTPLPFVVCRTRYSYYDERPR